MSRSTLARSRVSRPGVFALNDVAAFGLVLALGCSPGAGSPAAPPAPATPPAAPAPAQPAPVDAGGPASADSGGVPSAGKPDAPAPAPAADAQAPAIDVGGTAPGAPIGDGIEVTVAAGELRREASIVKFKLEPAPAPGQVLALRGADEQRLPVQVDAAGTATFILPALAAGAEAKFRLETTAGAPAAAVTATREADGVKVSVGDAAVFRYQMQGKLPAGVGAAFLRGGYLHPIVSPAGVTVTDDYPGDHRHHHGLWSAWASSSFEGREVDFWNMGGRTAKVDFDSLTGTWSGPVHGGLEAKQVHVSLAGGQSKTALDEIWRLTVYRTHTGTGAPPYFVFDLDSTQTAASNVPLMLHKYIYGGFALRGAAAWRSGGGVVFLTSEGRNRGNGDGTNARWCFIGGPVDGKVAGYAALGHPENFRAPQPVRINPTDPFFSIAPVRDSGFDIAPGKPYVSRYRIVVSDGAPDKALLDRLWDDYAKPPTVTVRRP